MVYGWGGPEPPQLFYAKRGAYAKTAPTTPEKGAEHSTGKWARA